MGRASIALLVAALTGAAGVAHAADAARGKATYDRWCSGCHDPGGGRDHAGTYILELRYKGALPAALEQRTDLSGDYVKSMVRTGRSFMPRTRKTEIGDDDLDDLAAYLSKAGK